MWLCGWKVWNVIHPFIPSAHTHTHSVHANRHQYRQVTVKGKGAGWGWGVGGGIWLAVETFRRMAPWAETFHTVTDHFQQTRWTVLFPSWKWKKKINTLCNKTLKQVTPLTISNKVGLLPFFLPSCEELLLENLADGCDWLLWGLGAESLRCDWLVGLWGLAAESLPRDWLLWGACMESLGSDWLVWGEGAETCPWHWLESDFSAEPLCCDWLFRGPGVEWLPCGWLATDGDTPDVAAAVPAGSLPVDRTISVESGLTACLFSNMKENLIFGVNFRVKCRKNKTSKYWLIVEVLDLEDRKGVNLMKKSLTPFIKSLLGASWCCSGHLWCDWTSPHYNQKQISSLHFIFHHFTVKCCFVTWKRGVPRKFAFCHINHSF